MKTAKFSKVPCAHFFECSGCPLMELSYADQLKKKKNDLLNAFENAGFPMATIKKIMKDPRPSPKTLGYRNKAKWILQKDEKTGELKMGIYKMGTHQVVDIPTCSVHAPLINEISLDIKKNLVREKVAITDGDLQKPSLRYLIVRYSFRDKKVICVFVTTKKNVPGLDTVIEKLQATFGDKIIALVQNINDDAGNVLLGEANRFVVKNGELTEQMGALRVSVGPLSFLQVNSAQAAYLYQRVKELLGKGPYKQGLDLYSGVGLMAMHLASSTEKILSVEEVGPAALEGVTAARRNKIHNVLQLCADAHDGVMTFHREWGKPDWVVVNPPRKGCEPAVLQALLQRPPKKIVYVSCGPKSLARDLKFLTEEGSYKIVALEPVDMFPQTAHIECIAVLEEKKMSRSEKSEKRPPRQSRGQKGSKLLH
ncbi:MAG: 23S rRNA (uracil(1939)-C(5))-methyltransferase RlmD [Bdellovibrionota bacterium]